MAAKKKAPWPESASELYQPSDRRWSAKLMTTFADRGCHVSVTDPYGRILGYLDRSRYFFFQVVPQLYSRGWVGSVPDPLLLRKSGSAGNRTRTSGSVARNTDHYTTEAARTAINLYKTEWAQETSTYKVINHIRIVGSVNAEQLTMARP
jgi:hypothetical protein